MNAKKDVVDHIENVSDKIWEASQVFLIAGAAVGFIKWLLK